MRFALLILFFPLVQAGFAEATEMPNGKPFPTSEDQWRALLTPEQFRVMRGSGTECAFSGGLLREKRKGTFHCAGCGSPLFASGTKFKSGTGWPSFFQPVSDEAVGTKVDRAYGMVRIEVHCNLCKGHLGHVFPDGPKPTGKRYCINSVALVFVPEG